MRLAVALTLLATPATAEDWATVSAIFQDRCVVCHSGEFAPLGLQLDTHDHALAGSETGPVLLTGDPEGSPLVRRIKGEIEPRMPMDGPPWLTDAEIAAIEAWVLAGLPAGEGATPPDESPERPAGEVWFDEIEPILKQRCVKCHSDGSILGAPPEGLRLSSLEAAMSGDERIVILPGNAPLSLLWRHVAGLESPRMPFDGPPFLTEEEIDLIAAWIDGGARDAEGAPSELPVGREIRVEGILTAERAIDGGAFTVTGDTRVEDGFSVGGRYELRAVIAADGTVVAERLRAR